MVEVVVVEDVVYMVVEIVGIVVVEVDVVLSEVVGKGPNVALLFLVFGGA